MKLDAEKAVYEALKSVYSEGAYSTQILNRTLNNFGSNDRSWEKSYGKPYITRLFYGVLEKSVQFDYIISKLVDFKPKTAVCIIIKIGLYLLQYTDTPNYAAVSKTVALAKQVGKGAQVALINAVLRKSETVKLPPPNTPQGLGIVASYPEWIVNRLTQDCGVAFVEKLLLHESSAETHIRVNKKNISDLAFRKKYPTIAKNKSELGYYVTHNVEKSGLQRVEQSEYVIQSLASMRAVHKYLEPICSGDKKSTDADTRADKEVNKYTPKNILDLCAAPGGKSVYLKELLPSAKIIACDIHDHRVELIKKYADSVGVKISVQKNDAIVFNSEFENQFDLVICDAPCTGIGIAAKKPEILWNRKESDITELQKLQLRILSTAQQYVKDGGRLSYSTCTLFKAENEIVANRFLKAHSNFTQDGLPLTLFPHIDHCDGFFAVNFRKLCYT